MAAVLAPLHPESPGGLSEACTRIIKVACGRSSNSPKLETPRRLRDDLVRDFTERAPKAVEPLEEGLDDAVAVMVMPAIYRKGLRITNCAEWLDEGIRRQVQRGGIKYVDLPRESFFTEIRT